MSTKSKSKSKKQGRTTTNTNNTNSQGQGQDDNPSNDLIIQVSPPGFAQRMITSNSQLTNHLPPWVLMAFQTLIPFFSNSGLCDPTASLVTKIVLYALAVSCFFACFTDSFTAPDGKIYYGWATFGGFRFFNYPETYSIHTDLRRYKIGFTDLVHAVLSVLAFAVFALRDKNVYGCFGPLLGHAKLQMMDQVSLLTGLLCSTLFLVFPTTRHGLKMIDQKGKKLSWTTEMDNYLLEVLANQVRHKVNNTFNNSAYKIASEEINKKFGVKCAMQQIKNHMRTIKKKYAILKDIIKAPGFGWNDKRKMVVSDPARWSAYIQEHPEANVWKGKVVENFGYMKIVFERDAK